MTYVDATNLVGFGGCPEAIRNDDDAVSLEATTQSLFGKRSSLSNFLADGDLSI